MVDDKLNSESEHAKFPSQSMFAVFNGGSSMIRLVHEKSAVHDKMTVLNEGDFESLYTVNSEHA